MQNQTSRGINACLSCRRSKSKCISSNQDGPCDRCTKKALECVFEGVIKRRGKDRKPRASAKRIEAAKQAAMSAAASFENQEMALSRPSTSGTTYSDTDYEETDHDDNEPTLPHPFFKSRNSNDANILYTSNFPEFAYQTSYNATSTSPPLLLHPDRNYQQNTYWDYLIGEKMSESRLDRNTTLKVIAADLSLVFQRGDFIATMFHLPSFFEVIMNSRKRGAIEPALMYALLAISYVFKGRCDQTFATESKLKALNYAERSHSHLMSAISTSNISLGLAQAAVCLQYYEFLPKPLFDVQRLGASLTIADTVIRTLGLTTLDADKVLYVLDDDAVPIKTADLDQPAQPEPLTPVSESHSFSQIEEISTQLDCPCMKWTYNEQSTQKKEGIRFRFLARFALDESDENMVKAEEIRRVVWGALNQSWYQQMFQPTLNPLYINDSSNYGIFLTSEHFVANLPDQYERDWSRRTMYALLDRGKLLCHGAMRLRLPPLDFHLRALKIIQEADNIEAELGKHTCHNGIPRWQVSNALFITKLVLTAKLRRMNDSRIRQRGYFTRIQAKKWLEDHSYIYRQFIGGSIRDAPMILGVLSVQALRCLDLFGLDSDLVLALYVARGILGAIEQLLEYHPCDAPAVQITLEKIRNSCNFESESVKRAFKPPHPPPHPPTVEELEKYMEEHNQSCHASNPSIDEVDIIQYSSQYG
ncbi:hypothetical protein E3P81_03960 [Wallemia ichthyophaga]|nr:hypothetical protein E3P97_03967 [Wallemia ichthyophaga]TIB27961.1 hypothetical protein E3P85_03939 [Wallemia ichthyophaga]TIB43464.1 hypothetical protein E3P82_03966 [Wallemia ichthyophaga]TIB45683.1 hypothetical protein E3P81_03960 [Wallemia ichthyophaga]TIB47780.1 hypothetical protein E3P80_03970 [Wallemia ichthyophaga]